MRRHRSLVGRHVLVTGGSSGIGLATAIEARRRGAFVSIVARGADRLAGAAEAIDPSGAHVDHRAVDVSDRDAVHEAVAALAERHGPVDVLVCCAGVAVPGYFHELGDEVFRETIDIDYFGTLWPIRAVADSMVERGGGTIIGVSSLAGVLGVYGYSAYSPAKFAVRGLLEVLRAELAPRGVHVACVCPPDVDTPQLAAENLVKPPETAAISGGGTPLAPELVARHIVDAFDGSAFLVLHDVGSRLIARTVGLAPRLFHTVMDRTARKAGARR